MRLTIDNSNLEQQLELMMKLSKKRKDSVSWDHSSLLKIDSSKRLVIIQTISDENIGNGELYFDIFSHSQLEDALLLIDLGALQRFSQRLKKCSYLEFCVELPHKRLEIFGVVDLPEKSAQKNFFDVGPEYKQHPLYSLDIEVTEFELPTPCSFKNEELAFGYNAGRADAMFFENVIKLMRSSTSVKSVVSNISLFPPGIAVMAKGKGFQLLARALASEAKCNVGKSPSRLTLNYENLVLFSHALSVITRASVAKVQFRESSIILQSEHTLLTLVLSGKARKLKEKKITTRRAQLIIEADGFLRALKEIDVAPKKAPLNLQLIEKNMIELSLAERSKYASERIAIKSYDSKEFLLGKIIEISRALIFRAAELFVDDDLVMTFEEDDGVFNIEISSKQSKNKVWLDARRASSKPAIESGLVN